ncbi:hypothetical protein [Spirosoma migulaei]
MKLELDIMETSTQNTNKELTLANKCFIEGIYRLYALGHVKVAEVITALINVTRFNIENHSIVTKEQFEDDYVKCSWDLHNYSKSVIDQLPNT